jgi:pyruvate formate lyase activating enzyme
VSFSHIAGMETSKGLIFNIQRFSVNDGPGIRTTVFLKGCPLHCRWCHNPESISPTKEIMLREDRCLRCGDCVAFCKHLAIRKEDGRFVTDRKSCERCGECVEQCYADAREVVGKEVTVSEIMPELLKDAVFYDESGGGVSLSGGEPLLQHEFALALLQVCKANGLHTVVDTTGFTSPAILERISQFVDLFLYDLKTLNDGKHIEFTGVSNQIILENLERLVRWEKDVIVRIPIIPAVNDDVESIRSIGAYLGSLGRIREIQLLPYHKSGVDKYQRLGAEYLMRDTSAMTTEQLEHLALELRNRVSAVSDGG